MKDSKIQWTTHTFNPWRGCTKVAAGCANCYADAQAKRNPGTLGVWGNGGMRVVASEAMWREPVKWDKAAEVCRQGIGNCQYCSEREFDGCEACGGPFGRPRVFCASMADVFEDWKGPIHRSNGEIVTCPISGLQSDMQSARRRLFRLIDDTPNIDWLLLTKRPENIRGMWPDFETYLVDSTGRPLPLRHGRKNVLLGTSIATQEDADRNVPELLECRPLAAKLFLSIEPMVGPVNLRDIKHRRRIGWNVLEGSYFQEMGDGGGIVSRSRQRVDWVIVGGESGPHARPCRVEWIRDIVRQCNAAGVPCFVKQLGANVACRSKDREEFMIQGVKSLHSICGDTLVEFDDPKGGDWDAWPEDLRVREFPAPSAV